MRLHPVIGDGDANPGYNRATQRLTDHYNALQKLQEAGITEHDPRLAPFGRPKPDASPASVPEVPVQDRPSPQSSDEPSTAPLLAREDAERLARCLMTCEQYGEVQDVARAGKGHAGYDDAVRRMYDHADAKVKLHNAGLLEQYAPPNCNR